MHRPPLFTTPFPTGEDADRESKIREHKQWLRSELGGEDAEGEDVDSSMAHGMKKNGRVRTMSTTLTVKKILDRIIERRECIEKS